MKHAAMLVLIGCYQLYAFSFTLPVTLHGKVFDQKTKQMVSGRVYVFYDTDTAETNSAKIEAGEFTMHLPEIGWYIISIKASGYHEATDTLWVINEEHAVIEKEYFVDPIEVGHTLTLKNIYFNVNKATLTEQSFPELDKMVDFFVENPQITFEIAGHTDNFGEEDYNLMLSQKRAQTVVDYFVSRGVSKSQLSAKGYGETKPIDTTGTKAGTAKNRRVEVTVLTVMNNQ